MAYSSAATTDALNTKIAINFRFDQIEFLTNHLKFGTVFYGFEQSKTGSVIFQRLFSSKTSKGMKNLIKLIFNIKILHAITFDTKHFYPSVFDSFHGFLRMWKCLLERNNKKVYIQYCTISAWFLVTTRSRWLNSRCNTCIFPLQKCWSWAAMSQKNLVSLLVCV